MFGVSRALRSPEGPFHGCGTFSTPGEETLSSPPWSRQELRVGERGGLRGGVEA